MEFAVSLTLVGKAIMFVFASMFVAIVVLSPVNDQGPGKIQFSVFAIVEVVMFAFTFDFISLKMVA